mmetsp:Transcript_23366/g.43940  ORF Transcript_23366/g.43940 Transcript_23366/m.43940 type:complete len:223 (+) Transcript_23366:1100-1768(+)
MESDHDHDHGTQDYVQRGAGVAVKLTSLGNAVHCLDVSVNQQLSSGFDAFRLFPPGLYGVGSPLVFVIVHGLQEGRRTPGQLRNVSVVHDDGGAQPSGDNDVEVAGELVVRGVPGDDDKKHAPDSAGEAGLHHNPLPVGPEVTHSGQAEEENGLDQDSEGDAGGGETDGFHGYSEELDPVGAVNELDRGERELNVGVAHFEVEEGGTKVECLGLKPQLPGLD